MTWYCRRPCRYRHSLGRSSILRSSKATRLRNYYHWLALTYVVTLVTNPAISIPCGIDEHAIASIPGLGRPRPDLDKLARPTVDLKSIATHPPLQAATAEC